MAYIYIIVITGQLVHEGVVTALRSGANDYLHKGVSREELAARLQTAVRIISLEQRLRLALDQQTRLAASDALTGLPNRRAFSKRIVWRSRCRALPTSLRGSAGRSSP